MPIEFGFTEDPSRKPEFTDIIKDSHYALVKDIERGRMVVLLSFSDQFGGIVDSQPIEGTHAYMRNAGMYRIQPTGEHTSRIYPNEVAVETFQFEDSPPGYLWIRHFIKS